MTKYKMIVTDLDGTLLKDDKTISEYTKNIINLLRGNGIKFVIATARPIRRVKKLLPFLEYDAAIYHNGANICENEKIISKVGIENPVKLINAILTDRPNTKIAVEVNDFLYANFNAEEIWKGIKFVKTLDFLDLTDSVADKIIIKVESMQDMKKYQKYLPDSSYIQLSENVIGMIMNKNATKSNAIKILADRMNISTDEIVVFGDDYNDVDMLENFGKGVAVGNALDEIKNIADEICGTNEKDGVAKWINENIICMDF